MFVVRTAVLNTNGIADHDTPSRAPFRSVKRLPCRKIAAANNIGWQRIEGVTVVLT